MRKLTLTIVAVACLAPVSRGDAAVLEVDRERPGAYDSIEAAIDVAENGDEIVVAPGLYEVRAAIRFNATGARPVRNLVLRSSHGPDRTEIRLVESTSSIFVFDAGEDSRSVVQGFRIRGGKGTGGESDPFYSQGGAIYCSGGSSPRFVDCKITGQDIEGAGGAIACNNASPVFIGCDISQNTARIGGAMLAGGPHSKPILKGCSIVGNRAREVPGILVGDEAIVTLEDCVVRGNHAELGLGAIRSDRGILHLERVRFDGNTARSAGAISCDARSELTARNCVFVRNSVTSDAGAIYVGAGSKAALSFCTIAYNTGPVHGGGAIFVTQSELVIENSILWGNGFGPIYPPGESGITIERSIVEGGWPGTGNLTEDPRLVEASGYELLDGSPAIDAASSLMPPELDLVGNPRPCGDGPDIGAFEHGCAMLVRFRRGDANLDAKLDLSDAVFVLDGLFEGGTAPVCDDAADVNDDGRIDISDPIVALRYLFLGAPASIAAPGLDCGEDLTDDALECAESGPCGDV